MDAALLRRKLEGWQAAGDRARAVRSARGAVDPTAALHASLELCALVPGGGSFLPRTAAERAGVDEVRRAWALLRLRLLP